MSIPMTKFWRFPVKKSKDLEPARPRKALTTYTTTSFKRTYMNGKYPKVTSITWICIVHIMTCSWFNTNIDSCVLSVSKSDWIFFRSLDSWWRSFFSALSSGVLGCNMQHAARTKDFSLQNLNSIGATSWLPKRLWIVTLVLSTCYQGLLFNNKFHLRVEFSASFGRPFTTLLSKL